MRIAYVVVHLGEDILKGGVGKKINSQIRTWTELGHTVQLFVHTPDGYQVYGSRVFQYQGKGNKISQEFSRSGALKKLINAVREYSPDIIYFRYGLFTFPLQTIFRVAPVVVEVNTNDVDEYRHRGLFYYWINRLTRSVILGNAAGIVYISRETTNSSYNEHFKNPSTIISNGVDFNQFEMIRAPRNQNPHMVFVGSPGYPWHGVDKLVSFARRYPDVQIEVVGYTSDDLDEKIPGNMVMHGFINHENVKKILKRADASFGTLALHRKAMGEASPLKVREALGYGIPTILAYEDTDLDKMDFDFILKIPNQKDNIENFGEQIRGFAYKMMGQRADRNQLIPFLEQHDKEKNRLDFFKNIINLQE